METALEVLERSYERLRTGWVRGAFTLPPHDLVPRSYCILGSVSHPLPTEYWEFGKHAPTQDAARYLHAALPWLWRWRWRNEPVARALIDYNDHKRRTHEQMLALCERAIELCRADNPDPVPMAEFPIEIPYRRAA